MRRVWMASLSALAVVLTAARCVRASVGKPDLGMPRTVEAGVPVVLGGEAFPGETRWEFGDGSRGAVGAQVRHVFRRAGTFTVHADAEDVELAQIELTVVPRPVWHAIPPSARVAVALPRMSDQVDMAVDFAERLLGAERAKVALEEFPLLALALEQGKGQGEGGIAPDEGVGIFTLGPQELLVSCIGVSDEREALDSAVHVLERGGGVGLREGNGTARVRLESGITYGLFTDRGYLYLVALQREGAEAGRAAVVDLEAVRAVVQHSAEEGLEGVAFGALRAKVADGTVLLYVAPQQKETLKRSALVSLTLSTTGVKLDGFVGLQSPLLEERLPEFHVSLEDILGRAVAAIQLSMLERNLSASLEKLFWDVKPEAEGTRMRGEFALRTH